MRTFRQFCEAVAAGQVNPPMNEWNPFSAVRRGFKNLFGRSERPVGPNPFEEPAAPPAPPPPPEKLDDPNPAYSLSSDGAGRSHRAAQAWADRKNATHKGDWRTSHSPFGKGTSFAYDAERETEPSRFWDKPTPANVPEKTIKWWDPAQEKEVTLNPANPKDAAKIAELEGGHKFGRAAARAGLGAGDLDNMRAQAGEVGARHADLNKYYGDRDKASKDREMMLRGQDAASMNRATAANSLYGQRFANKEQITVAKNVIDNYPWSGGGFNPDSPADVGQLNMLLQSKGHPPVSAVDARAIMSGGSPGGDQHTRDLGAFNDRFAAAGHAPLGDDEWGNLTTSKLTGKTRDRSQYHADLGEKPPMPSPAEPDDLFDLPPVTPDPKPAPAPRRGRKPAGGGGPV